MDDSNYADLLPSLSPLDDPDAALLDRKGAMEKLLGKPTPEPTSWLDRASAADSATPPPMAAATPSSAPAVPAGVTPSGKTSGLADSNAATIGLMQSDYAKSSQDVQREADQPDLATTSAPLQAQRTKDAAPIPAYDSQTGKVLDKYKPSFGQRLMRGVEGFARGGVLGVVDPAVGGSTPYGAPNQQYGRDVQQQQGRVASDDQQLKNAADNWKATSERLAKVASDRKGLATMGKDVTGASVAQQGIPIDQQKADTGKAEAYNNSPEGKAEAAKELNAQTLASRQAQMSDPKNPISKASAADKAYFMAQGKLPDPDRYHAPAEQILFNQAHAAWVAQNPGKQPGLDDIRSMVEASKGSEKGTLMMIPDGKGGSVAQMVHSGDAVPAGATTVAGLGAAAKDAGKEAKAAQAIVDEADLAHQAAQEATNGNAEGDVDLALSFFKTMKGSSGSGIRFTQAEQNLIRGARSSAGDLLAIGQKVVGGGQMFTPKQREDVLRIIDLHANQAKKHVSGSQGGDSNTPPPGATVRDYTALGPK